MVSSVSSLLVLCSFTSVTMATTVIYEVHPVSYEVLRPTQIDNQTNESVLIRDDTCTTLCKNTSLSCCSNGGQLTDGDICDKKPTARASNSCWVEWHSNERMLTLSFKFDGPQRIRSIIVHAFFQPSNHSGPYSFCDVTIEFRYSGNSVIRNTSIQRNSTIRDQTGRPFSFTIDVGDLWAKTVTLTFNSSNNLALGEVTFIGVIEMLTTPSHITVCLGCDASFQCNLTDPSESLSVRWYKHVTLQSKTFRLSLNSPSTVSSLLSLRNVMEKDSGVYVCEVDNSNVSLSSSVTLTVLPVGLPTSSSEETRGEARTTFFSDSINTNSTSWYKTELFTVVACGAGSLIFGLLLVSIVCCLYCRYRYGERPVATKQVELQMYRVERVETVPIGNLWSKRNNEAVDTVAYQNGGVVGARTGDESRLYTV